MVNVEAIKKRLEAKYALRKTLLSKKRKDIIVLLENRLVEIMDQFPSVEFIFIFGSIANQIFFNELSDIDIAVKGLDNRDELKFSIYLENILRTEKIDLIMMEYADKDLIENIKNGILVYEKKN